MKTVSKISVLVILGLALSFTTAFGGRGKGKKPLSAYIKSAKIHILSGNLKRYSSAIGMLDTLFMFYGPHAEGLNLRAQIEVDYIEKSASLTDKALHVDAMVAYFDSLNQCCDNEEIKKKYRKDCKKFVQIADSIRVKYWREFYNSGIEQLRIIEENAAEIKSETDSAALAYLSTSFDHNVDSCIANMQLAIVIDPSNYRTYVAVANAFEAKADFVTSTEWLVKGLARIDDRPPLLLPIAYNYINQGDYSGAIPFLSEYCDLMPDDVANKMNLGACYNNSAEYKKAVETYRRVLEVEPSNTEAMVNIGQYFNKQAGSASSEANKTDDEAAKKEWNTAKEEAFDSSLVYFSQAIEISPEDPDALDQHALINAIRGNYEIATKSYEKLNEIKPGNIDNLSQMGDCYLYMKDYKNAARSYEMVAELDPNNCVIWQNLSDLYLETGEPKKRKAAEAKADEICN